jgi:hypothetical protein
MILQMEIMEAVMVAPWTTVMEICLMYAPKREREREGEK